MNGQNLISLKAKFLLIVRNDLISNFDIPYLYKHFFFGFIIVYLNFHMASETSLLLYNSSMNDRTMIIEYIIILEIVLTIKDDLSVSQLYHIDRHFKKLFLF